MPTDPSVQTPEQREAELRAAGWVRGWVDTMTRRCRLVWQHPDGRRFGDAYGAWCVMRAEKTEG